MRYKIVCFKQFPGQVNIVWVGAKNCNNILREIMWEINFILWAFTQLYFLIVLYESRLYVLLSFCSGKISYYFFTFKISITRTGTQVHIFRQESCRDVYVRLCVLGILLKISFRYFAYTRLLLNNVLIYDAGIKPSFGAWRWCVLNV